MTSQTRSRRAVAVFIVSLTASLGTVSSARAQADAAALYAYRGAERDAQLIAKAKAEGTLLLYTSMSTSESGQLAQAFEKKYGVRVQIWRNLNEAILQRTI